MVKDELHIEPSRILDNISYYYDNRLNSTYSACELDLSGHMASRFSWHKFFLIGEGIITRQILKRSGV